MEKTPLLYTLLILLMAVVFVLAMAMGRYPVPPGQVFKILSSAVLPVTENWSPITESVILRIRLPRVIMALAGGLGLGICGAIFQGIFRNPLVSPGVVGVTSGAGFGAALAILIFGMGIRTQLFAFIFGGGALFITWTITKRTKASSLLVFVLSGVIVNMFFQAMISLVKFMADSEEKLPSIVYWLMGSLSSCSWRKISFVVPLILLVSLILFLMRRRINLLSLGEETVRSLGVSPVILMNTILVLTTVVVSAIVSIAGIVGWIGLIIPHIARMITGPDHEKLIPVSALLGAIFFMIIDTAGRSISPQDLPLGILTALLGAPLFIGLLIQTKGEWNL